MKKCVWKFWDDHGYNQGKTHTHTHKVRTVRRRREEKKNFYGNETERNTGTRCEPSMIVSAKLPTCTMYNSTICARDDNAVGTDVGGRNLLEGGVGHV